MIRADYLSFADAVAFLDCSESAFCALVINAKIDAYVAAREWSLLWIRSRFSKSVNESKRISHRKKDEIRPKIKTVTLVKRSALGRHKVQIKYEDGRTTQQTIRLGTGYFRLPSAEAAAIGAAGRGKLWRLYSTKIAPEKGIYAMARIDEGKNTVRICKRPVQLPSLWFSTSQLESLTAQNSKQHASASTQRKAVSEASTNRHTKSREEIFGAAFSVVAQWRDQLMTADGVVEATKVAKLIDEKAKIFWPDAQPPLQQSTIEEHLRRYLKLVRDE